MEQNEFYEVNGCMDFIPVDLIEEGKCTKELEVVTRESGRIISVPSIYKFPKPQEPQKPVVPKFVADYIELNKGWSEDGQEYIEDDSNGLWFALDGSSCGMPNSVSDWLFNEEKVETFARAWLDGYEIEKKKLYTVEIPNPNSAGGKLVLFKQQSSGRLILDILNPNINKPKYLNLTESEIKQDFDFLWQFKKEVE